MGILLLQESSVKISGMAIIFVTTNLGSVRLPIASSL